MLLAPATARYRLAEDPRLRVVNLGMACCVLEVDSAVRLGLLVREDEPAAMPDPIRTVLLVSGTVTDALAPGVRRAAEALTGPVSVVAFGACASTGGPYWDAPTVTKGTDQLLPVHSFVPGCPPRPEALVAGLLHLVAGDRG